MKFIPSKRALLTAIRQASIEPSERLLHLVKLRACLDHLENARWNKCVIKKVERLAPGEKSEEFDYGICPRYNIHDYRSYMQYGHSRSRSMQCQPHPSITTHYVEVWYCDRFAAGYGINAETGQISLWID